MSLNISCFLAFVVRYPSALASAEPCARVCHPKRARGGGEGSTAQPKGHARSCGLPPCAPPGATGYAATTDGFESHIGINHLAHFYLTQLLRDTLVASAPARVVAVSSAAEKGAPPSGIDFGSWMARQPDYEDGQAYGQSKLANVIFSRELAAQLNGTGVTSYSCHPVCPLAAPPFPPLPPLTPCPQGPPLAPLLLPRTPPTPSSMPPPPLCTCPSPIAIHSAKAPPDCRSTPSAPPPPHPQGILHSPTCVPVSVLQLTPTHQHYTIETPAHPGRRTSGGPLLRMGMSRTEEGLCPGP